MVMWPRLHQQQSQTMLKRIILPLGTVRPTVCNIVPVAVEISLRRIKGKLFPDVRPKTKLKKKYNQIMMNYF